MILNIILLVITVLATIFCLGGVCLGVSQVVMDRRLGAPVVTDSILTLFFGAAFIVLTILLVTSKLWAL